MRYRSSIRLFVLLGFALLAVGSSHAGDPERMDAPDGEWGAYAGDKRSSK